VADDFLPTMRALLDRDDPPDHIIIETSGLALPKPLVKAFNWPEVRTRVTVDGVIAVVDGRAVADGRFAADPDAVQAQREGDDMLDHDSPLEELFEDQLACADLIVLNKTDLLVDGEQATICSGIGAQVRPAVKLVTTTHGLVEPDVLLGLDAAAEDDLDARPSHHDSADDHDHDDFESFAIDLGTVDAPETLVGRLTPVIADHDILRIKGFVDVAGKDMRLVVQGVGPRVNHYYDRDWQPNETRTSRLVVIGECGLDQAAITAALKG
jgi:cobalamin biosynthesis protein CobW